MLPVQTVMIRYMVLVYRWGRGRLSTVGAWGGSLGGAVTDGGARRRGGAVATRTGREKAPPTRGRRGLLGGRYSVSSSSPSLDLSNDFAGLLVSPELGSKR